MLKKIAAWSVHFFTATGLLAAFQALLAAVDRDWRMAMLWLFVCLIIDGIDGTFARMAKVREVLPHVQGMYIDYVIDFFTYAILPAYIFYEAVELPHLQKSIATGAMLLSAALYYGIENMVSQDGKHFIGFPVMWNMVVFYLIFVIPGLSPTLVFIVVLLLAVLHFVPIHFAYPSKGGRWWPLTMVTSLAFFIAATLLIWNYPESRPGWRLVALLAAGYFGLLAIVDTLAAHRGK